jgi:L-alanine-DL-glutamate epimerase-like enolase superfamily enzyme
LAPFKTFQRTWSQAYDFHHSGIGETDPLAHGLFREHPELRDGHLHLNDRPGFGLEVDWAFVDRNRLRA